MRDQLDPELIKGLMESLDRNGISGAASFLMWLAAGNRLAQIQQVRLGNAFIVGARYSQKGEIESGPLSIEYNQHGHMVLTLYGLNFPGLREIDRLEVAQIDFGKDVVTCLTTVGNGSYDSDHRLVAGLGYRVVLMPTSVISSDSLRTTEALCDYGIRQFGYGRPIAGIVPSLRLRVSHELMIRTGFKFIVAPHKPINNSLGRVFVLKISSSGPRRILEACHVPRGTLWDKDGAFAFFEPSADSPR